MTSLYQDSIFIRDLLLRVRFGDVSSDPLERTVFKLQLRLLTDLRRPCHTDDLTDSIDYRRLKKSIVQAAESMPFTTMERLGECAAQIALANRRVCEARVELETDGLMQAARSIGIAITRRARNGPQNARRKPLA